MGQSMTIGKRAVEVMQVPENLSTGEVETFLRKVEHCIAPTRPWLVLDCSSVRQLNESVSYLLLCCLEEAMKRNGDVKLAALPPTLAAALEVSGMGRLFEIFRTLPQAVNSFHQPLSETASEVYLPGHLHHATQAAA